MTESTQEIIAIVLVCLGVGIELLRRSRKKKNGSAGCDGCDAGASTKPPKEAPLRFYQRR